MISGLTALSGMTAQQAVVNTAAHNVANANTPGFKKQSVSLATSSVGGTQVAAVTSNHAQGPLQLTGVASHLAINGDGFFALEDSAGNRTYSRTGNFIQDKEGFLRSPNGGFLLSGGSRVQIPAQSLDFEIASDGVISALDAQGARSQVGRIQLAGFPSQSGLQPQGGNQLSETAGSGTPEFFNPGEGGAGTLQSGALEMSNVDFAEELVQMMVAQRSFEANAKMITVSDELLKTAVNIRK